jgi:hypothetical protein
MRRAHTWLKDRGRARRFLPGRIPSREAYMNTSSRTRVLALTTAVLGVGVVAGCGGGTDRLSKDEFLKQGNAICTSGNQRINALVKGLGNKQPTPTQLATLFDPLMAEVAQQVESIDALSPPKDLQADLDAILADTRKTIASLKSAGAKAFFANPDDPFKDVNQRLKTIGLTVCGEDSST